MLDRSGFEDIKDDICASGRPSSGDDLVGMAIDFDAYLSAPPLWRDVSVLRREGTEWLIEATAAAPGADPHGIAAELSEIWSNQLRYNHREGHMIEVSAEGVDFHGVTQIEPVRLLGDCPGTCRSVPEGRLTGNGARVPRRTGSAGLAGC